MAAGYNQATFQDTWNELRLCIPDEFLAQVRHLMLKFYSDSRRDVSQRDTVITTGETWIERAINRIEAEGGSSWLKDKALKEDLTMDMKTPQRMENIREVTGLARILFTTLVNYDWIPLNYKAFLFCCADDPCDTEYPHEVSTEAEEGDGELHLLWAEGHFRFAN